uniref:Uncharacterized protein n=1 Tax=Anguilla anguilla TaxID=7936 RepID=A0A0E9V719_ANGAN
MLFYSYIYLFIYISLFSFFSFLSGRVLRESEIRHSHSPVGLPLTKLHDSLVQHTSYMLIHNHSCICRHNSTLLQK